MCLIHKLKIGNRGKNRYSFAELGGGQFLSRHPVSYILQTLLSRYRFSVLRRSEIEKLQYSIERYEQYTSGTSLRLNYISSMCHTFAARQNCRVRVYAFTLSTLDLTEFYFHLKQRSRKRCGVFWGNGWQSLGAHTSLDFYLIIEQLLFRSLIWKAKWWPLSKSCPKIVFFFWSIT